MHTPLYLFLNSRDELYRIDINTIAYFEAEGNYTTFVLANGQKGVTGMNLMQMQTRLSDSLGERAALFARIGKRHIVNLSYVFSIKPLKGQLTLSNGTSFAFTLSVSKEALKSLKDMMINTLKTTHTYK